MSIRFLDITGRSSARRRARRVVAVTLVIPACGPDMGPPPDENVKNNPAMKPPAAATKAGGAAVKVKSIKDRAQ